MKVEESIKQELINLGLRKFILIGVERIDSDRARYSIIRYWSGLRDETAKRLIKFMAVVGDLIAADTFGGLANFARLSEYKYGGEGNVLVTIDTPFPIIITNRIQHIGIGEIPVTMANSQFIREPLVYVIMNQESLSNALIVLISGGYPQGPPGKLKKCLEKFEEAFKQRKLEDFYIDGLDTIAEGLLP